MYSESTTDIAEQKNKVIEPGKGRNRNKGKLVYVDWQKWFKCFFQISLVEIVLKWFNLFQLSINRIHTRFQNRLRTQPKGRTLRMLGNHLKVTFILFACAPL